MGREYTPDHRSTPDVPGVPAWSSQDSAGILSVRYLARFELLGAQAAQMTMPAGAIMECLDGIGHVVQRKVPVLVDVPLDPFLLKAAEEGLGYGMIPAVPIAAPARLKVIGSAEAPARVAGILRTLIRVN